MRVAEKHYNWEVLHEFIVMCFEPEELLRFCRYHDKFKIILRDLSESPSHHHIADKIINFCERQLETDLLIQELAKRKPAQYFLYESKLFKTKINPANLKDFLFRLDRVPHKRMIEDTLQQLPLNAPISFLIHGQPYCGQKILVQWLIHFTTSARVSEFETLNLYLGQRGTRPINGIIWRELNRVLMGVDGFHSNDEVLGNLLSVLKTRDIFIVIHDWHIFDSTSWDAILQEFWHKVIAKIQPNLDIYKHRLFFILVDWDEKTATWERCHTDPNQYDYHYPLKLPPNHYFDNKELTHWLNNIDPLMTVETLLQKTEDGLPDFIYEWLCGICDTSLETIFTKGTFSP